MRGRILYGTKKFREDAISFLFLVGGEGEKFYTVLKSFGIGGYSTICTVKNKKCNRKFVRTS